MKLYHTGFQAIPEPDIRAGRKNADFGQGFYLSKDEDFSRRWAKERKGMSTVINTYEFSPEGLTVKTFSRDEEWYDYIFRNRAGAEDLLQADVIIGPIAGDTLYNTWGILTSGVLQREQALQLLQTGPVYQQTVIKTEKGLAALRFLSARVLEPAEVRRSAEEMEQEEKAYQEELGRLMASWDLS